MVSFFTRIDRSRSDIVLDRTAKAVRFGLRGRKEPFDVGDRIESGRYVHRFTRQEFEAELTEAGFTPAYYGQDSDFSAHAVAFGK